MHFASLLPAVMTGTLAALVALLAYLLRHARTLLDFLPASVARLLLDPDTLNALLSIVLRLASYANLSKEERRKKAIEFVAHWLENHGVHLSDQQLALLVELLYSLVKRHHAGAVAPEPLAM